MQQCYQHLGYAVIRNSCKTENGLDELKMLLKQHTGILIGQSGVGKSSIIKSLLPDKDIQTQAISAATGFGAHTTTTAMLYHLPESGEIIDSPGVREFNVSHLDAETIRSGFIEFRKLQDSCKFNNCTHLHEPGCAVLNAVTQNEIDAQRWENYRKLLASE
jgi:ribosome biogenesis GTPase